MKNFTINIAKAYTLSDWRGLPAHRHHALVYLCDTLSEADAMAELERLSAIYPWPEFHLSLSLKEVIDRGEKLASTAPADFLKSHGWDYPSINDDA